MTLIDDARSLAQDIKSVNGGACNHCAGHSGDHREWCPTLCMPRIMAALEAADMLLACSPLADETEPGFKTICLTCLDALVATLCDERITA